MGSAGNEPLFFQASVGFGARDRIGVRVVLPRDRPVCDGVLISDWIVVQGVTISRRLAIGVWWINVLTPIVYVVEKISENSCDGPWRSVGFRLLFATEGDENRSGSRASFQGVSKTISGSLSAG